MLVQMSPDDVAKRFEKEGFVIAFRTYDSYFGWTAYYPEDGGYVVLGYDQYSRGYFKKEDPGCITNAFYEMAKSGEEPNWDELREACKTDPGCIKVREVRARHEREEAERPALVTAIMQRVDSYAMDPSKTDQLRVGWFVFQNGRALYAYGEYDGLGVVSNIGTTTSALPESAVSMPEAEFYAHLRVKPEGFLREHLERQKYYSLQSILKGAE